MKKYIKFLIIFFAVAIIIPQIALAAWWNPFSWNWAWVNNIFHFQQTEQKQEKGQNQVACTMDAKQCPDGSYVGREGPNCEFKACPEIKNDETKNWKTYTNTEYGFEIKLPDSWDGYLIEKQQWTGWAVSGNDIKYFGVKFIIKNPNTTQEESWQDIPVLLFSKDQWKLVIDGELAISAAPIGPEKIGENFSYIFATPPRWYGFTDAQGWQEAVEIVKTFKAF